MNLLRHKAVSVVPVTIHNPASTIQCERRCKTGRKDEKFADDVVDSESCDTGGKKDTSRWLELCKISSAVFR